MDSIYQGESLPIEVTVNDSTGEPANLLGAQAFFACKSGTLTTLQKNCTIVGNVIYVELTAAETATMTGTYSIEIKLRDMENKVDSILVTALKITKSILPILPE